MKKITLTLLVTVSTLSPIMGSDAASSHGPYSGLITQLEAYRKSVPEGNIEALNALISNLPEITSKDAAYEAVANFLKTIFSEHAPSKAETEAKRLCLQMELRKLFKNVVSASTLIGWTPTLKIASLFGDELIDDSAYKRILPSPIMESLPSRGEIITVSWLKICDANYITVKVDTNILVFSELGEEISLYPFLEDIVNKNPFGCIIEKRIVGSSEEIKKHCHAEVADA